MAQQNAMMPGHPANIRKDLAEVERIMAKKDMKVVWVLICEQGGEQQSKQ